MNNVEIEVTIICLTYNHEKYISSALEGFLAQDTDFPFEIIVHDDASMDGTAAIVKSYESHYPSLIKAIIQDDNQYSKGVDIIREIILPRARGKYIALCEGDDYWTDPLKLQKQHDSLESFPGVDLCAHSLEVVEAESHRHVEFKSLSTKQTVIPTETVILGEGGLLGTNTLFLRSSCLSSMPLFAKQFFYDYTLQILAALRGGVLYLPDCMSVYRFAVQGSWSSRLKEDPDAVKRFLKKKISMLMQLDNDTNCKYHNVILGRILLYHINTYNSAKVNRSYFKTYRSGYSVLPFKEKISVMIKCTCPWLIKAKHHIMMGKRDRIWASKKR